MEHGIKTSFQLYTQAEELQLGIGSAMQLFFNIAGTVSSYHFSALCHQFHHKTGAKSSTMAFVIILQKHELPSTLHHTKGGSQGLS